MFKLRPYQEQSINECREAFKQGHKEVILMSPTGSGKSVIIRKILELADKPNAKLLFVVHRTILIKQMRETLKGINVEISTLQKKGKHPTEKYDLIIHDECHYSWNSKLKNNLNSKFYLGLSATPTDADGIALKCDKLINFMQMPDLIEQGYAVPFKVLSTSKISTKNLKKSGNDYNQKEAYKLMAKSEIKRDILNVFNEHCKDLKTIIYAVNIEHAEELHKEFLDNGIANEVIHSKKKTEDIIERFKNNEVRVLINVSILTIGFDDGDIECLLLAAPTKSVVLAQQIYGRVSRLPIKSNKTHGLIVDCANVIEDTMHPMQRIDINKVKEKRGKKQCKQCGNDMHIINKKVVQNDQVTYTQTTHHRCSCGYTEITEEMKVYNLKFCDGCGKQLLAGNVEMKITDKKMEFAVSCECGHENIERSILLTDKELKELEYQETMQGGASWEKVKLLLREECKRNVYKWQYSERLLEHLQMKNKTPKESEALILDIRERGQKISKVMFI